MRNTVIFYLNGERQEVQGAEAFLTLSDYLRYQRGLTGTKVVCAEGDCGACTLARARFSAGKLTPYESINSCIAFVWQLDRTHLITVEGLGESKALHPAQRAMVDCHGAQCGYCTPGFVAALACMKDAAQREGKSLEEKDVKNALTGNLCRCTGYQPIIEAGLRLARQSEVPKLSELFDDATITRELAALDPELDVVWQDKRALLPASLKSAFAHGDARIVSGATDLGVLHNKGRWQGQKLMSLSAIEELSEITYEAQQIVIGARVGLSAVARGVEKDFPEFSRLLHVFASPQIKHSASLVGNLMNASPIADTIPFLKVAHARVRLQSASGVREVDVNDFLGPGYKEIHIRAGEIVTHVVLPKTGDHFKLYKVARREDLDISAVTMALRYQLRDEKLSEFKLAVGGVGPSVLRFQGLEQKARGERLSEKLMRDLAVELDQQINPLSDVRGSDKYRRLLCRNLLVKFAHEVAP